MEPIRIIISNVHDTGTFSEYKKQISNKLRAKASYASAISQNVFASFDKLESEMIKKLPVVI